MALALRRFMLAVSMATGMAATAAPAAPSTPPTPPTRPIPSDAASGFVSSADASAVRKLIQAQFDAFAADDAKAAFAYATTGLRELFGTPDQFMTLVRANYPAVYRHAAADFAKPEWVAGVLVQAVHITDSKGALWLAIYQLEPQADRSWRIGGCQIARAKGVST